MGTEQKELISQYLTVLTYADMDERVKKHLNLLKDWLEEKTEHSLHTMRLKLEICGYGYPHWRGDCEELKCATINK